MGCSGCVPARWSNPRSQRWAHVPRSRHPPRLFGTSRNDKSAFRAENTMNLSKFFIDRPIFAGVLSILIFLAGLISLTAMAISAYPDVVPPGVVVRASYRRANPKAIGERVATRIEEQINGVEGMLYMSSQATTAGQMTLTVTFRLGTDPDKAQQLVENRWTQAEPRLPG